MKERTQEKIKDIKKYLNELEKIVPANFSKFKKDLKTKAACERYFEKIVEAAVDLTFLIIKEIGLRDAKEDTDAFVVLAEAGFIENPANWVTFCAGFSNRHSRKQSSLINGNVYIDKELSEKLQDAKSMRNLIVHQYEIIEDIRVYEAVKDKLPADINNFLSKIKKHKQD